MLIERTPVVRLAPRPFSRNNQARLTDKSSARKALRPRSLHPERIEVHSFSVPIHLIT
jgi:hypothetical protein